MSQEKVERHKQEKANRKKIMKQEKIKSTLTKILVALIIVVAFGWIGYSGYNMVQEKQPEKVVAVNINSVNDYIAGLSAVNAQ
jgi:cell division septal protein FtsQ